MSEEDTLGKLRYGERNERGQRFIRFCQQHNLKIRNGVFKRKGQKVVLDNTKFTA